MVGLARVKKEVVWPGREDSSGDGREATVFRAGRQLKRQASEAPSIPVPVWPYHWYMPTSSQHVYSIQYVSG